MFKVARVLPERYVRFYLEGAKTAFYRNISKVIKDEVVVSLAEQSDKKEILSIRQDISTDYLPAYFDFMMKAENRECYIAEIDKKIVGFSAVAYVDGGRTAQGHSLRIHSDYERSGVFKKMKSPMSEEAKKRYVSTYVYVTYMSDCKYGHQNMRHIYSKPNFFTVIDSRMRKNMMTEVNKHSHKIHEATSEEITEYIVNKSARNYLFPGNMLLVDGLVYTTMVENVPLFGGRSTKFYSTFTNNTISCVYSGLLSAGRFYECPTTPGYSMYVIDLFGSDTHDVKKHINFHLNLAFANISGPFFFEVNVDEGDITGVVCMFLSKMGFELKMNTSVLLAMYIK